VGGGGSARGGGGGGGEEGSGHLNAEDLNRQADRYLAKNRDAEIRNCSRTRWAVMQARSMLEAKISGGMQEKKVL